MLGVVYYFLPAKALPSVQRLDDRPIQQAFAVMLLSVCIGLALGSAWPRRARRRQPASGPRNEAPRTLGAAT